MSDLGGRAALQIVGTIAGSFFGPVGAAVGGAIGATAGNYLFPLDPTAGPRLSDLQVQASSYVGAVPIIKGTFRATGNLIWASDLRETATETEVGGKGGPAQTHTAYTYDVDCAIAICEGPMASVRRIWADSRLIYDMSAGANLTALMSSGETARNFRFYLGTETQLPDPTMEAALGVGNVPAYRGVCYIVWQGFQVGDYGNRIPNFSFEVCELGAPDSGRQLFDVSIQPVFRNWKQSQSDPLPCVASVAGVIRVARTGSQDVNVYGLDGALLATERRAARLEGLPVFQTSPPRGVWRYGGWQMYCGSNVGVELSVTSLYMQRGPGGLTIDVREVVPNQAEVFAGVVACVDEVHFLVLTGSPPTAWYLAQWNGRRATLIDQGTVDPATAPTTVTFGISPVAQRNGQMQAGVLEADLRHLWTYAPIGHIYVWQIDAAKVLRRIIAFDQPTLPKKTTNINSAFAALWADRGICIVVASLGLTDSRMFAYTRLPDGATVTPTVGAVVETFARRAGLQPAQIDTASLTAPCHGYAVASISTARAAIEPLTSLFAFQGVESGTQLRFTPRAGSVVATIPADDLGAASDGTARDLLETRRAQETDLPSRLTVRYRSTDADYQPGAQSARRRSTGSRQTVDIHASIALPDQFAANAAELLLVEQWASRNARHFATIRKWSLLEPGDIVRLELPAASYTVRLLRDRRSGPLIEWEGVDFAAAVYNPNAAAAPVPGAAAITALAATRAELLDIPMLRDGDDDAGLYVVACGYGAARWPGAQISRQVSGGGPFVPLDAVFRPAVIGRALTVLPNFAGANIWDESSTVDVDLVAGALASATHEAVLAGANAAMLGAELLLFRDVLPLTATSYRLSGFLRARKGTDAGLATHAAGERFALLTDATVARIPAGLDEVGTTPTYRISTLGAPVNTDLDQALTHTGAALRPLSPVHAVGERLANEDMRIHWTRRSRIGQEWRDLVDVPLDEPVERYEVDILDATGVTVLRTLAVTGARTVTYTAAQQVADFGNAPGAVNTRIHQMSERVGRGTSLLQLARAPFAPFLRDWNDNLTTGQTLFGNLGPSHSATSGRYVLNPNGGTAYSRLDNARTIAAFDLSLDVIVEGSFGRAGIVYRTTGWGGSNGAYAYAAYVTASGPDLVIQLMRGTNLAAGGVETLIATLFIGPPTLGTFRLRVVAAGSSHQIWLDGVLRIDATDATFPAAGQFGLYALSGTLRFDNLSITF